MKTRALLVLFWFFASIGFAQTDSTKTLAHVSTETKRTPPPFVFKPTVGLGTGMFSFYGDLYEKHLVNPQVSRVGFELSVSQPLNPFLRVGFYTMFGKLGANERLPSRNINFESQIRVGGVHFEYNFDNFLRKGRLVSPYLSLGFESFEFLTKTDLFDANGVRYHYWSDGSIRSLDQNDPFAFTATFMQRDYSYETDVREQNLDGFGKYPERSFAVPVGAGFLMHLNEKWDCKVGTTFHFTFTDYIDGVTSESVAERKGNAKNDNYLMSSVSLRYNLTGPNQKATPEEDPYYDVDFYALDQSDYDTDGVLDLSDSCAGTPPGVAVDARGCPLDSDGDLTPDYRDREQATSAGSITDEYGIGLSDSIIQRRYEMYMDSTGKFADHETIFAGRYYGPPPAQKNVYMVALGTYRNGVSNEQMANFLSIPDISTTVQSDSSTLYTAGKYADIRDAEKRRKKLVEAGITNATLVYRTPDGKIVAANNVFVNGQNDPVSSNSGNTTSGTNSSGNTTNGNTTSGNTTSGTNSSGSTNSNSTSNGNTTSGNTTSGTNSSGNTTNGNTTSGNTTSGTNSSGNTNSNSTSNGNTTSGNTTSGTNSSGNTTNGNTTSGNTNSNSTTNGNATSGNSNSSNTTTNTAWTEAGPNDNQVVFRVQLGAFRNRVSKTVFYDVPDLVEIKTNDGLYKYTTGSFTNFDAAATHQANMLVKGYRGAFIVAYKNGKRIPLSEAGVETIKKESAIEVEQQPTEVEKQPTEAMITNLVAFKVQLGVFKGVPPEEIQQKLNAIPNVEKIPTVTGLTRYCVGSTSNYKDITALRETMKAKGFPDAFVIAFFKGQPISVQEALDMLSE